MARPMGKHRRPGLRVRDEPAGPARPPRLRIDGLVLSDRPGVKALERAAGSDVEAVVLPPDGFVSREEFDRAVADLLRDRGIDVVVTAGYLRLLGVRCWTRTRDAG